MFSPFDKNPIGVSYNNFVLIDLNHWQPPPLPLLNSTSSPLVDVHIVLTAYKLKYYRHARRQQQAIKSPNPIIYCARVINSDLDIRFILLLIILRQ